MNRASRPISWLCRRCHFHKCFNISNSGCINRKVTTRASWWFQSNPAETSPCRSIDDCCNHLRICFPCWVCLYVPGFRVNNTEWKQWKLKLVLVCLLNFQDFSVFSLQVVIILSPALVLSFMLAIEAIIYELHVLISGF